MTLARFTPLSDASLREAIDGLFEESFIRPTGWADIQQLAVPVDLWATKDADHPRADLPGLSPDELVLPGAENQKPRSIKINASANNNK